MAAVNVSTSEQLYLAIKNAKPGDAINAAAGTYVQPAAGTFRLRTPAVSITGDPGGQTFLTGGYDNLTVYQANGVTLRNLHSREAGRVGFYAVGSDNLTMVNCSGVKCAVSGALTSKCHFLLVDGFYGAGNVSQHGFYHSNHGMKPTVINSIFEGNGRCGFQINADRSQALPPVYFEQGQINDAVIKKVICRNNGLVNAGASMNLLGCWNALVEDCELLDGLAGGLSLSNDDNQSPEGLAYGSRNCTIRRVRITGKRGISLKNGSFGARFEDVTVNVSAGPCIDWDFYSGGWEGSLSPWVPGEGKKVFYGPSYQSDTAPLPAPPSKQGTTGAAPFIPWDTAVVTP